MQVAFGGTVVLGAGGDRIEMALDEHDDIGLRLSEAVGRAQRKHRIAAEKMKAIMQDIPSGLPQPDGVFRIRQAGKEEREALNLYLIAVKRYSEFLLKNQGSQT